MIPPQRPYWNGPGVPMPHVPPPVPMRPPWGYPQQPPAGGPPPGYGPPVPGPAGQPMPGMPAPALPAVPPGPVAPMTGIMPNLADRPAPQWGPASMAGPATFFEDVPADDLVVFVRGVTKVYGEMLGLNDVSLTLSRGTTAIVGPNGAGKSTLFQILTGLVRPSRGTVRVLGQDPGTSPSLHARIGFCPDFDAFYGGMTGFDFLTMLARLDGDRKEAAGAKAREALRKVRLLEVMDRKVGTYSRGMRQRVKLAQAILHDPELLFLDEPTVGTDPITKHHLQEMFRTFENEGKSLVISTHVLHEVESITDRIVLINRGRVLAEGKIAAIRKLIDLHPQRIWIETDEFRKLAALLLQNTAIVTVQIHEHPAGVSVLTYQAERIYDELPVLLDQNKISVRYLGSPDDNLNAVFAYLTQFQMQG